MELQSLRTFHAVVEEGGILSASRKLNTVQSNVTTRIKNLEAEIGTELFYRKGRGLELSPSGRVLLSYAQQMLQLESQANVAVRQVGEMSGELRIGAMETFAALRLPSLLKEVMEVHNRIKLHIETNPSSLLIKHVLEHKLDCAIVGGPVEHPDLLSTDISEEELVLVRSKLSQCEELPLILFRDGCAYRARAITWQRENGYQANGIMEFGSLDGILGCVAVGLGCTILPQWAVSNNRYHQELEVDTLEKRLAKLPTVLIRHKNAAPLKAIGTLIETAIKQSQYL